MNMISQLRQRVVQNGSAMITLEEFNQLQAEWITRARMDVSDKDPLYGLNFLPSFVKPYPNHFQYELKILKVA